MKKILIPIGTRGDMETCLSCGEILKEKGHEIICTFPEQFRDLAEKSNMDFASTDSFGLITLAVIIQCWLKLKR